MKIPIQRTIFLQQNSTFGQWQEQVNNCRQVFVNQPQKCWLLFETDSYLFSVLFFALMAANKKIILPPSGQIEQIKQCLQFADIFVGSTQYQDIKQLNLSLDDIQALPRSLKETDSLDFDPECQITFFTSGSSGQPKAINKTFEQLIIEIEVLEKTFSAHLDNVDQSETPIVMATVSHQHIYGLLFKLLWPIWFGRDIDLKVYEYPEHLVHQIKQYSERKICLISSPAYYHRLLKDNVLVEIKSQLAALFSSGGPLDPQAAISLQSELGLAPIEVFGSTETGGIAWRQKQSLNDELWCVFDDIDCRYTDNSNQLSILSPYVDKYNWYQTDDLVELINNKKFKLLGRSDRVVKIEEKRCSLDEIQHCLIQHSWVDQAYVMALGGKNGERHYLAAVVELSDKGRTVLNDSVKFKFDRQLKSHLKEYFEALVVPRKFRYIDSMPHNSQGKLNKQQLEAYFD